MEPLPAQQDDIDRELAKCSEALVQAGKLEPTSLWATKPTKAQWSRQHADELRVAGNESYKAGALHDAIRFYENAVSVASVIKDEVLLPTYLSNLSAAYYESGDYERSLDIIDRAFEYLQIDAVRNVVPTMLDVKLRLRECRCLLQIQEFDQLLDAVQEVDQTIYDEHAEFGVIEDAALHSLDQLAAWDPERARKFIPLLPRYRPCMNPSSRNDNDTTIGYDTATSALTVNMNTKGEKDASDVESRLLLSELEPDQTHLAFFFGGCGDPRHVLATLIDVQQQNPDPNMDFEIRMALVDRDPAVIARNILIFFILDDLASKDLDERNSDVIEILALLHYTYLGAIMPNWAYESLLGYIRVVSTKLCSGLGIPKWMTLSLDSIDQIIPIFKFWIRGATDAISIVDWMGLHRPLDGPDGILSHPNFVSPELQQRLKESRDQARIDIKDAIFNFSDSQLNTILVNRCTTIKKVSLNDKKELAFKLFATDEALDTLTRKRYVPDGLLMEYSTFYQGSLKMLYGPDELHYKDPKLAILLKNLWSSWGAAKKVAEIPADSKSRSTSLQAVKDHIQAQWKVNVTLIREGYKSNQRTQLPYEASFDPFAASQQLVAITGVRPLAKPFRTYDYTAAFFLHAAKSIKSYSSKFLFEWMVDESHDVLEKITRSPEESNFDFFDRIYFSSPPDTSGGLLPQIVDSTALLKPVQYAFMASKALHNASDFNSVDALFAEYLSLGSPTEVRQLLGIGLYSPFPEPFNLAEYIRLRPIDSGPASVMSVPGKDYKHGATFHRSSFVDWLYSIFLKIAVPTKASGDAASRLQQPLNLHSFFRLLLYLQNIDFPAHCLSSVIDDIIRNRVITRARPTTRSPQVLDDLKFEKNPPKPICVTPFSLEMEAALTMWFPLLTIGINAVEFMDANNINKYSIKLKTANEMSRFEQTLPVLCLWFSTNSAKRINVDLARDIVGNHNAIGSIRILSTFEWDYTTKTASFMASVSSMELLEIQGFNVRLVRTDTWETVSVVTPVKHCEMYAALAEWQEPM